MSTKCCNGIVCRQCVRERGVKLGVIKCPLCDQSVAESYIVIDQDILQFLEQQDTSLMCEFHSSRQAIQICKAHSAIVCEECANRFHGNEYEEWVKISDTQRFNDYC